MCGLGTGVCLIMNLSLIWFYLMRGSEFRLEFEDCIYTEACLPWIQETRESTPCAGNSIVVPRTVIPGQYCEWKNKSHHHGIRFYLTNS